MRGIQNIFGHLSTGVIYTYAMILWSVLWMLPTGVIHAIAVLLWELPYIFSGLSSETFFNISLVIKILILAYPITTLSPWSMLKTTLGGLLLFVGMVVSLSFMPADLALKTIFMDVGFTSKAYTVLVYLLLSNLLIPIVAREDFELSHIMYMALGTDELLTVLFRTYMHFSVPAVVALFVGISSLVKKRTTLRGAER